MNQRLARLIQLLQIKQEATRKAYAEVMKAKEQYEQNKTRHDQLVSYKSEYVQQLEGLGNQGTYIGKLRNRVNFISHLDTALLQLHGYLAQLAKTRIRAELHYKQLKLSEEGVCKLIERVRNAEQIQLQRLEQKESDEYAQKQWYSKTNNE